MVASPNYVRGVYDAQVHVPGPGLGEGTGAQPSPCATRFWLGGTQGWGGLSRIRIQLIQTKCRVVWALS